MLGFILQRQEQKMDVISAVGTLDFLFILIILFINFS